MLIKPLAVDGPFCFCLTPTHARDWLQGVKLDAWIAANAEAWAMIPGRLKRHLLNHSAQAEEDPHTAKPPF